MMNQNDIATISSYVIRIMEKELIRLIILLGIELIAIVLFVIGILRLYPMAMSFVIAGSLLFDLAQGFVPKIYQGPTVAEYVGDYFSEKENKERSIEANQKNIHSLEPTSRQIQEIKPTHLTSVQKSDPQIESIRNENLKI